MKRLSLTIIVLLMFLATACNKSSETPKDQGPISKSSTTQAAPASPQLSKTSPGPGANSTAAAPFVATTATAPGMNPPHGQPNHRCDIAVGVPLDSPAGTGKTPANLPQPTITAQPTVTAQSTTTPTAPGMNPPHGQPNHRCDIAVGAPLNSPPSVTR
jgi:hypothetical protein